MTMSYRAGTHAMAMRQPLSVDGVRNFLDQRHNMVEALAFKVRYL